MKNIFCVMVIFLLSGTVYSQVVLDTEVVNTVRYYFHSNPGGWTESVGCRIGLMVNTFYRFSNTYPHYFKTMIVGKGLIEFNINQTIDGGQFPTSNMTENNWVALLTGLKITSPQNPGYWFPVNLSDLADEQEDGQCTPDDFYASSGLIQRIIEHIPPVGTVLEPVDVTDALRRDLFGDGADSITSGFLISPAYIRKTYGAVRFDSDSVRLEIFVDTTPTPFPTRTPTPTGTPTQTPTPFPTWTPQPTNTPTPTPEPTTTPTPVVTPGTVPAIELSMPSHYFRPGDLASCTVYVSNYESVSFTDIPLFVVLDVYGQLFFAPSFEGYSWYTLDIPPGQSSLKVLPSFFWPDNAGIADNIHWYAAMLDETISYLIGQPDMFTFGWGY